MSLDTSDRCLSDAVIDAYHAGDLADAERAGIEVHLAECEACRQREAARRREAEAIMASLRQIDRPMTGEDTVVAAGLDPGLGRSTGSRHAVRGSEKAAGTRIPARRDRAGSSAEPVFPRIEGYEIVRILGRGGMGIVYEAVQKKLGRHVALKVLPAVVSSVHRDLAERFRREATAASKLHHTNIIPIYDYGESRDGYFYAMELLDGQPLSEIIRRIAAHATPITSPTDIAAVVGGTGFQPVNEPDRQDACPTPSTDRGKVYYRQVAAWMAETAEALHYAHLQGLIHRDVKPGNIMVCRDGRIVLMDFGLVKEVGSDSVTATGSILGTYRYMSPEQVGAKRIRVDARTDIYSLGVSLYEMLTLQPAFVAADQSELLGQILWKEPTPPRKIVPSVPVDLQTICMKAMEKSPAARYANGREMAEDLRQFIGDLPIRARPVGALGRLAKLAQRHPGVSVMSAVVLVLAVIFGAFALREAGKRRAAEADSQRAREAELEQAANALAEKVSNLNLAAVNYQKSRDWDRAEGELRKALELDPQDPTTHVNLARVEKDRYYSDGNPSHLRNLLGHVAEALRIEPRRLGALNLQIVAYREQDQLEQALQVCEEIRGTHPLYYPAAVNAGGILALGGDFPQAEREFTRGVELASADETADSMPWRNLSALQHFLHRPDAWGTLQTGLDKASNETPAGDLALLALFRLTLREHLDADVALDMAIAANAKCAPGGGVRIDRSEAIPRILALARLRKNDLTRAVDAAKLALEQHKPVESHIRLILAVALARQGQPDEARKEREAALAKWKVEAGDKGYVCRIENGLLWFVSQAEVDELHGELAKVLGRPE